MRMALEELGTTSVKVGQILSTRVDLLPSDFTRELAKLQDSLKPLPADVIKKVISEDMGRPIDQIFASFDPKPVGVASIGQAHAATLLDGTEVVVKTRKPGVVEQVEEDMDILHQLALSATEHWEEAHHYNLAGVVQELADTLMMEMDYVREGHSAEYFARFFQEDPSIHIPRIFWEFTTPRVITLERIQGVCIMDVQSLDKAGVDRKELAKRASSVWLKMVFDGEMFHADPHPGNLFAENDGRLGLIDFGMTGVVDDEVREHLGSVLKGVLDRDVDLLIDSMTELGAVCREFSRDDLRKDLKRVMSRSLRPPMKELRMSTSLEEVFAVMRRDHVQLPANTFLLLKTVAMAQSLGIGLDPDFNIFPMFEFHVKQLLRKKYSPLAMARRLPSTTADMAGLMMGLPRRLNRLVRYAERGELQIRTDVSGLETHLEHLERIVNRMVIGIVAAAIIIGAALFVLAFRVAR